ncbi:hypothetical protein E3N88_39714 [Mikania micrantha]|uniref:Uncharacterized protein n=1 Tax=Mikania micrantha TaxID=192012 RepID=A0A5N6LKT0_9ASTR|nr:hypothetical protein E3N88_39714 [Mikania micrantha]
MVMVVRSRILTAAGGGGWRMAAGDGGGQESTFAGVRSATSDPSNPITYHLRIPPATTITSPEDGGIFVQRFGAAMAGVGQEPSTMLVL